MVTNTPTKTPGKPRATTPTRTPSAPTARERLRNDQGEEGIQVGIRMRPLNSNEGSYSRVWKVLPKYNSIAQTTEEGKPVDDRVMGKNFFTFDKTFGESTSTQEVYNSIARNIVNSVCNGLNGTIFAYGQTSSGKTFTMQGSGTIEEGSEQGKGGIVHLAAKDIFAHIEKNTDRTFLVRSSFLEIYNEDVRDLLAPENKSKTLQIREDPQRGVFVQSEEVVATDFSELLGVLFKGEKSRSFASTAMNERSSRSHTIFRVTIESRAKVPEGVEDLDGAVLVSTLNLVDLAGSESVRHTGATGDRQKEGGMINQSLLTLSRVISSLGSQNQGHINFRDSKLTRLLQPSLQGNARMSVICCATPSVLYTDETRSTLSFASRAKLVKTNAQVNEVVDPKTMIRRLQRELLELRRGGESQKTRLLSKQVEALQQELNQRNQRIKLLNESKMAVEASKRCPKRQRQSLSAVASEPLSPFSSKQDSKKSRTNDRLSLDANLSANEVVTQKQEVSMFRDALVLKGKTIIGIEESRSDNARLLAEMRANIGAVTQSKKRLEAENNQLIKNSTTASDETKALKEKLSESERNFDHRHQEKIAEIQSLQDQLESALELRRGFQQEAENLKSDKLSLEKALADAQSHLESETNESKRLAAAVEELNTTNASLLENTERVASLVATKDNDLSMTTAKLEIELIAREKDATLIATLKEEQEELNATFEALQNSSREAENTLRFQLEKEKARSNDLMTQINEIKESHSELLKIKDGEVSQLRDRMKRLDDRNCAVKEQLETVTTKSKEEASATELLKTELSESRSLVAELRQQLEIASDTCNESDKKIMELTSRVEESDDKYSRLSAAVEANESEFRAVDEAHKADLKQIQQEREKEERRLKSLLESLEAELASSAVQREQALNECDQVKESFLALQNEVSESKEQCKRLSVALEASEETLLSTEEALKAEMSEIQKEHQAEACRLQNELSSLQTTVEETEGKMNEQKEHCETARERTMEVESDLSTLEAKFDECNNELCVAKTELGTLNVAVESATKEKEQLLATAEELKANLDQLSADYDLLTQERIAGTASLQAKLDGQMEAYSLCLATLDEKEGSITSLRAELETNHRHVAELEMAATTASERTKTVENDLVSLEARFDECNRELCDAKAALDTLNVALQSAAKEKEQLLATAEELKAKLDQSLADSGRREQESIASTAALQAKLDAQTEAYSLCLATLDEQEGSISSLRSELETNHRHVAELEVKSRDVDNHRSEIVELQTKTSILEEKLLSKQKANEDAATQSALESDILRQTINDLENTASGNAVEVQLLHERVEKETEKSAALGQELESCLKKEGELRVLNQKLESNLAMALEKTNISNEVTSKLGTKIAGLAVVLQASISHADALVESRNALEQELSLSHEQRDLESTRLHNLIQEATTENARLAALASELEDNAKNDWTQKKEAMQVELSFLASQLDEKSRALDKATQASSQFELDAKAAAILREEAESLLSNSNAELQHAIEHRNQAMSQLEKLRAQHETSNVENGILSKELKLFKEKEEALVGSKNSLLSELSDLKAALVEARNNEATTQGDVSRMSQRCQDLNADLERSEHLSASLQKQLDVHLAQQTASVSKTMYDSVLRKLENTASELQAAKSEVATLHRADERRRKEPKECSNCVRKEESLSVLETTVSQFKDAAKNKELAQSEVIESLKKENEEAMGTIRSLTDRLQHSLRDAESEIVQLRDKVTQQQKSWLSPSEAEKLKLLLLDQEKKLGAKNERIKKLEQHKLTKSDRIAIQKMKNHLVETENKLREAEKELLSLKARDDSDPETDPHVTKVASLQFEKQAIETQLAKTASQCQRLEEERGSLVQAMLSSGHFHPIDINNIDVLDAVYGLCDQLSSLQKPSSNSQPRKIELLQQELDLLSAENSSLKDNIEALSTRQTSSSSSEDDNMMCLKEENLRLMKELKSIYRHRDQLRSELRNLRSQPQMQSFSTEPSSAAKLPTIPEQKLSESPPTPAATFGKENSPNKTRPVPPKLPRSTKKRELPNDRPDVMDSSGDNADSCSPS